MSDRQKADLGGLLITASEGTQEQKAGHMMCDSLVPWSQVQAMLEMVQVALNLKTGFAEVDPKIQQLHNLPVCKHL